jgi:acetolactate synthase small subunit
MQVFHIRYRNAQGALMRILNAVSRRGLDLTSVHAEFDGHDYSVTMLLHVTSKQRGQLFREWYSIVDVIQVHAGVAAREPEASVWVAHPSSSATVEAASAALA